MEGEKWIWVEGRLPTKKTLRFQKRASPRSLIKFVAVTGTGLGHQGWLAFLGKPLTAAKCICT